MLICEAQKMLEKANPELEGCLVSEWMCLPKRQHLNVAQVRYEFVIAVATEEVAMNGQAGLARVVRKRLIDQLRAMQEQLENIV